MNILSYEELKKVIDWMESGRDLFIEVINRRKKES